MAVRQWSAAPPHLGYAFFDRAWRSDFGFITRTNALLPQDCTSDQSVLEPLLIYPTLVPGRLGPQHNVAGAMAPSQEPRQQPINLIESAERCERRLNRLKRHATDCKTKHNSGKKKKLLEDVIARVHGNVASLKAWTAAIMKGRQTGDTEIIVAINAVFENIVSRADEANTTLNHRLNLSRLAFNKSKSVVQAGLLA